MEQTILRLTHLGFDQILPAENFVIVFVAKNTICGPERKSAEETCIWHLTFREDQR